MHYRNVLVPAILIGLIATGAPAQVDAASADMKRLTPEGTAESVGTIRFSDGDYGLVIEPALAGLAEGTFGLHIHTNPSCAPGADGTPGGGAGAHYDPAANNAHKGPYAEGHLGDLPVLIVGKDGKAVTPLLAPRVHAADLAGRSIMIHAQHDDYGQNPGGGRAYCGIVE